MSLCGSKSLSQQSYNFPRLRTERWKRLVAPCTEWPRVASFLQHRQLGCCSTPAGCSGKGNTLSLLRHLTSGLLGVSSSVITALLFHFETWKKISSCFFPLGSSQSFFLSAFIRLRPTSSHCQHSLPQHSRWQSTSPIRHLPATAFYPFFQSHLQLCFHRRLCLPMSLSIGKYLLSSLPPSINSASLSPQSALARAFCSSLIRICCFLHLILHFNALIFQTSYPLPSSHNIQSLPLPYLLQFIMQVW